MSPTILLFALGNLDLRYAEDALPAQPLLLPATLKSQSLLAYLAIRRQRPSWRDHLAALFWGDRPEHKARRSLSTALWHIRRCLPDDTILSDLSNVQFNPAKPLWIDVEAFEAAAGRSELAELQAATVLYRGDFLDGFYDEWVLSERYRLENLYHDLLARLMAGQEAAETYEDALRTALLLLDNDPLREEAHRAAMRLYCRLGQRNAALTQFRQCQQVIQTHLGVEPMAETQALFQAIQSGRFAVSRPQPVQRPTGGQQRPRQRGHSPLDAVAHVPLVGREQELAFLADTWQDAVDGRCSLVLISGEAGVGKTRLVQAFADKQRWHGARVLAGRCYEFERLLPYQPLVEALQSLPASVASAARATLPEWAFTHVARLAPDPFGHDLELPGTGTGPPGEEQTRLFEAVSRFLALVAGRELVLLVLEDLHWATDSTLELLHYTARHLRDHPLLIVGTLRPEAIAPGHPLATLGRRLEREGIVRRLRLAPLDFCAVEALISEMSGTGDAVRPLVRRLYQETEGNPFYLMEMVKALFEEGAIRLEAGVWQADFAGLSRADLPLPASVEETIRARVSRLKEDAREAVQLAAVLGKAFDFDPLRAAWGHDEEGTLVALDDLLRGRLIAEGADEADPDYVFTHHKIQEVVYGGLPRRQRQYLHGQVGAALEQLLGAEAGNRASELAFHFEQARRLHGSLTDKAISYLLQAGNQAVRQSANQEAIAYFHRGIEIIRALPDTSRSPQRELELQIALGLPTAVIHGYGSPEAKRVYDQARELCRSLEDTPALFTALAGLARYYGMVLHLRTSLELAKQLLAIAERTQETASLLEAYRAMGGPLFSLGRLKEAQVFWDRGIALYDPANHEGQAYRFGHDFGVSLYGYSSLTLWLLGYPERARKQSYTLYRLIRVLSHPSSQAYAHCFLAMIACFNRQVDEVMEHAGEAIRLGNRHGLPIWTTLATVLRGWVMVEQGQATEGLTLVNEGISVWRSKGTEFFSLFFLSLKAEACLKAQKVEEGLAAVSDSLSIAQDGGDAYWLAELRRLHGELLWAGGRDVEAVEACFWDALAIARQQEARMLELRAATSLAQLWRSQGKIPTARQLLLEVYAQFDQSISSHELQAARTLLHALS